MNSNIVFTAIASFNNAALLPASFFWLGLIMLPLFIIAYKMAPVILSEYFQKNRDNMLLFIAEFSLILWLILNSGNWDAIRDGAGSLPYIIAFVLFLLCRNAMARLRAMNLKSPDFWVRLNNGAKIVIKILFIAALAAAAASSTIPEFPLMAMQLSAVFFGMVAGYFSPKPKSWANYTMSVFVIVAIAMLMQPEYFRFGKLGALTALHLIGIASILTLASIVFVFRNFKPIGFIKDNYYRYMKWFLRFCLLLILILYSLTESVPILIVFALAVMAAAWLAAKHAKAGTDLLEMSKNLFAILMMAFGILTIMPTITAAGILLYAKNKQRNFWRDLIQVLK